MIIFFPTMHQLVYEILWKQEEFKRKKKAKGILEDLVLLEEIQIKAVLRLMKAKLLCKRIASGESISKTNMTSDEIKIVQNPYFRSSKERVCEASCQLD